MTDFTITPAATPTKQRRASPSTPRQANTALAWALVVAVALAPLPLGSVRPTYWAVWSTYFGLVGFVYFAILAWTGNRLRMSVGTIWPAALLCGLTCTYLVVQLLPLNLPLPLPELGEASPHQISVAPNMTLLMVMRQLTYALFAFLVMQVCVNDARRARILQVLTACVVAYATYGIYALQTGDTILGMPKWAYLGSATGPFVNRNSFATFLGLGAIIPLASACALVVRQSQRHAHDGKIRNLASGIVLNGLVYLFLLSAVVATTSRMGLLATLLGSMVVIVAMILRIERRRLAVIAVPVLLALLGVALVLFGQGLLERIGPTDASADNRATLYGQVLNLIAHRPWTGFGGGSFELAFPLVHQVDLNPDYGWDRAHSTYLTLWSELGLVFGSLPILIIAYFAVRLLGAMLKRQGSWTAQAVGLGAIVVGATHSLVDFSLEIPAVTLLFLALAAQAIASTTADVRA